MAENHLHIVFDFLCSLENIYFSSSGLLLCDHLGQLWVTKIVGLSFWSINSVTRNYSAGKLTLKTSVQSMNKQQAILVPECVGFI